MTQENKKPSGMIPWRPLWEYVCGLIQVFFVRPYAVWGAVLGPLLVTFGVVCIGGAYELLAAEAGVRISGTVLQVAGLGVVAAGIYRIRNALRKKERTPAVFKGVRSLSFSNALSGEVKTQKALSDLNERLTKLETTLETKVAEQFELFRRELEREASNTEKAITKERSERLAEVEELRKLVEEIEVGGIHLELMGLAWLITGVILGTLATELADPLCRACSWVGLS